MSLRCPSSQFLGVGRLPEYCWIINDRGYANVVSATSEASVYGLVYSLTPSDEGALDRNEGVPYAYTKEILPVNFWGSKDGSVLVDIGMDAETREVLVYIDRKRTNDDKPKEEYIYRMNMGIKDGVRHGIPRDYVDQVLRKYIPTHGNEELEELARHQALEFKDET